MSLKTRVAITISAPDVMWRGFPAMDCFMTMGLVSKAFLSSGSRPGGLVHGYGAYRSVISTCRRGAGRGQYGDIKNRYMKKVEFTQIDFRLTVSKYIIEGHGLRIIKKRIFSSTEFIKFEDIGTEIIKEKDRKFVWLGFSVLFLIISSGVFINRVRGIKVGNGAEIFHLSVSFLFFVVYQIRSKNKLILYHDAYTNRIVFNQAVLYRKRLNSFITQLLQKREIYLTNKYPAVKGLTLQEVISCTRAGLRPSDGLLLKKLARGPIERVVFNGDKRHNEYPGAISCITTEDNAMNIIKETREQLNKEGKSIFIYESIYGVSQKQYNKQYRLCLTGATDNIFEIMKLVGTGGPNYDVYTEDVIEKYKKWDSQFGLFPIGIGEDFCDFEIINRGIDYKILAEEVYEFSPDVVDQGAGTIDRLKEEMEKDGRIFLWWD